MAPQAGRQADRRGAKWAAGYAPHSALGAADAGAPREEPQLGASASKQRRTWVVLAMMGGIKLSTLPCPTKKGILRFAGGTCRGEGPAVHAAHQDEPQAARGGSQQVEVQSTFSAGGTQCIVLWSHAAQNQLTKHTSI